MAIAEVDDPQVGLQRQCHRPASLADRRSRVILLGCPADPARIASRRRGTVAPAPRKRLAEFGQGNAYPGPSPRTGRSLHVAGEVRAGADFSTRLGRPGAASIL